MDLVEISRRLENLLRIGTIHSVDHAAARCRVESGGLLTQWLPWLASRAGDTRTWNPPTVGEQAMVVSPSGEPAAGVVLVGLYSDAIPAPSDNPAEHVIAYPDGARITYDHASGALAATGIKSAVIEAAESITLATPLVHVTGVLQADDRVVSHGIVLHTHTHPGTGLPQ